MPIVKSIDVVGYSGTFEYTSGSATVSGTFNTDDDKQVTAIGGQVTATVQGATVVNMRFSDSFRDPSTASSLMTVVKGALDALIAELANSNS